MTLFYANKRFHSCMSFDLDMATYQGTCEQLQSAKTEAITERMQELLEFGQ